MQLTIGFLEVGDGLFIRVLRASFLFKDSLKFTESTLLELKLSVQIIKILL